VKIATFRNVILWSSGFLIMQATGLSETSVHIYNTV